MSFTHPHNQSNSVSSSGAKGKLRLSYFLARRIYRDTDGGKQVSRPAVVIAMIGIAIGLAVMIIAVSVVIGFKSEVRNKVIGFGSHIQISNFDAVGSYETHPVVVNDSMMVALSALPEVKHVQRYSTKPAIADRLKLKLGDKIYTYFIQKDVRARRLTVKGIYQTNFSEYDNLFLLTDLYLVNRLNNWAPGQVSGAELQVRDYDKLEDITYRIATDTDNKQDIYGGTYYVQSIEQMNPQIFAWLDLLDLNVWVILILMVGVAGFTMISGLLIIILERTQMIGILKALGANDFTIRKVFLWFSVFLIGKGMLWGNAIGIVFCILQSQFGLFKLDPETYYVSMVPVSMNIWLFLLINAGTLLTSVLMLVGPSYLITKINPADSMRYE